MKPDFSGWATMYNVQCSDGRTIKPDAFAAYDKKKVPLVWRHMREDGSPAAVLGHVLLEHHAGKGVRANAYFNGSPSANNAKELVHHGDVDQMSIKAINLRQNGTDVLAGDLVEVSLVPVGANREAKIDAIYMEHDGELYDLETAGMIYSGQPLELMHEDAGSNTNTSAETSDHSDGGEMNAQEVWDTLNDNQKALFAALLDADDDDDEADDEAEHEGDFMPTYRAFEGNNNANTNAPTLTHEQFTEIWEGAKQIGSLRESVLEHAQKYGITNIDTLFPQPKDMTNKPEWIRRNDDWVSKVINGVHSSPFTRVKTSTADITHEEARARGYIKTNLKKEMFFSIKSRITTPTTVYVKSRIDRDDMIDVTSFDVVAWIKEAMGISLREEMAGAILFGDNRPTEDPQRSGQPNPDKINPENIRPIAYDDEFYTVPVKVGVGESPKSLMNKIIRSRKLRVGGTGRPTLFTTEDLIVDLLLQEDKVGRRYYDSEQALATALGVSEIVSVPILDRNYSNDEGERLLGVIVNLADYTFGADPGGLPSWFDDFDLDYNQQKFLLETRRSGALTKYRSAIALWSTDTAEVVAQAPTRRGDTITVPTVEHVEYYLSRGTGEATKITEETVSFNPTDTVLYIEARPESGYRLAFNTDTAWSYNK